LLACSTENKLTVTYVYVVILCHSVIHMSSVQILSEAFAMIM